MMNPFNILSLLHITYIFIAISGSSLISSIIWYEKCCIEYGRRRFDELALKCNTLKFITGVCTLQCTIYNIQYTIQYTIQFTIYTEKRFEMKHFEIQPWEDWGLRGLCWSDNPHHCNPRQFNPGLLWGNCIKCTLFSLCSAFD